MTEYLNHEDAIINALRSENLKHSRSLLSIGLPIFVSFVPLYALVLYHSLRARRIQYHSVTQRPRLRLRIIPLFRRWNRASNYIKTSAKPSSSLRPRCTLSWSFLDFSMFWQWMVNQLPKVGIHRLNSRCHTSTSLGAQVLLSTSSNETAQS